MCYVCMCLSCAEVYVFVMYLYVNACGVCNVCEYIYVGDIFMWCLYVCVYDV